MAFFDPSAFLCYLMIVVGGGVRDLASCVSTDTYWKSKGATVTFNQLAQELNPVKPVDISKLIVDLDADDPKVREAATDKIFEVGLGALGALEETARDGSPEASARANRLLVRIRAAAKPASVRRLMAIRSLGESKQRAAIAVLEPLLTSRTLFEAEYARAAIATIEAKPYSMPSATEAQRAADVGILPARLDVVAQAAPLNGTPLTLESLKAQMPRNAPIRDREQSAAENLLNVLDTLGNVRLDAITFGFYAAPPGVPGNGMLIARGEFDAMAVSAYLASFAKKSERVNGSNVFHLSEETAIIVPSNRRIVFLFRQAEGNLEIESMTAALKAGAGDFAANADLAALLKSVDRSAPLWVAARLPTGMKELMGPFTTFETVTLVAKQSKDNDVLVTDMRMEAVASDKAQAHQNAATLREMLQSAVSNGRHKQVRSPSIKPLVDFTESLKVSTDDTKMIMTGTFREMPIAALLMGMRGGEQELAEPGPVPAPAVKN